MADIVGAAISKLNKKITDRFQNMFDNEMVDDVFININIDNNIINKLLKYQILHLYDLVNSIIKNKIALDGSGTGTGKTYVSIALCKHFNYKPIIVCPKSVMTMWNDVCKIYEVEPLLIVNYDTIKFCKEYDIDNNNKRITSNYLIYSGEKDNIKYEWKNIDFKNNIIIFDEVHKCKDIKSLNGKLLTAAKNKTNLLLLSATMADTKNNFYIYAYMLNLIKSPTQCRTLITQIIKESINDINNINPFNKFLFPKYGSIMLLKETTEQLPLNIISVNKYNLNKNDEINLQNILVNMKNDIEISKIIKMRQEIELCKIPIIIELTNKYLDSGKSVVIFVNFIDTLMILSKHFNTNNIIHGQQTDLERNNVIESFQKNIIKIIICTIQSGGQSINLHDTIGKYPRASIIIPSFSSTDFVQTLGRIYRSGTKSYCIQNIIFCANTYEDNIYEKIKKKINFLTDITDDDLFI